MADSLSPGQPVCLAFPQRAASHIGASYRRPKRRAEALRGDGGGREEGREMLFGKQVELSSCCTNQDPDLKFVVHSC